jgi:uncharacterized protein (DUF58 family)
MPVSIQNYFKTLLRHIPIGADGIARVTARQIYIIPTRTGLIFGSVVMMMLLGSLNYQNNLGLLFTFFLVAIGVLAMHHAWFNLLKLAIQIRGGAAVFAGERATFEVTLRAEQHRAHYDIQVQTGNCSQSRTAKMEFSALPLAKELLKNSWHSVFIPARDQCVVTLKIPAAQRGLLRLDTVHIATRHPMQLFRAWCYVTSAATTLIYPQPAAHAPAPEQDAGTVARPQQRRRNNGGVDDYLGSRPYRPGDSPHHIDWKAFARERGLLVKQFGNDQGQTVWLDWSQFSAVAPEQRLSLLARQVLDANSSGVRFGLRLPGGIVEPPAQGAAQVQRCLTHLALFSGG